METGRPILIVDDDVGLRLLMKANLEADGAFTATTAGTLLDAATKLDARDARFDAVILDSRLPDGSGFDFCTRLRQCGQFMPIILLTGADADGDVVRGLDAGANDYLTKPFRMSEFCARLRAQLRAFEDSDYAVFNIGPYSFRPSTRILQERYDGRRVRLTEKETAILKFMYRANGRTASRTDILHEVWGYNTAVTTHTLETHIYRLRRKIEIDPENARIVITERGGYRLRLSADGGCG